MKSLFYVTFTAVPSSPITSDDVFAKDGKFIAIGKENVAAKKETERLIMSKNIGKQFVTSTTSAGAGRQLRLDILTQTLNLQLFIRLNQSFN